MLLSERRRSRKGTLIVTAAASLLACGAAWTPAVVTAAAQQPDASGVPKVTVTGASGQRVGTFPTASSFSTRLPGGITSVSHGDAPIRTPITQYLRVHQGERVVIRTARAALSVHGALGLGAVRNPDRSRSVRATRIDLRGHRWALVLPTSSGRVDRLRISVSYANGASGYEAGIRLVSRAAR